VKLAAIDIGSNAARLLISEVVNNPGRTVEFIKVALVRVPLRLGFDVFEIGSISPDKAENIFKTIKSYQLLLEVFGVEHIKACATSAMRDASNSSGIINKVKTETGIEIRIISGEEEASLIYENHIAEKLPPDHSYLYIDVGGGSTDLTFFSNGKLLFKVSFNIGTIRLLKNQVTATAWKEMKEFIQQKTKNFSPVTAIGSGGNINKVFSLTKTKVGKPLTLALLEEFYNELSKLTIAQRIQLYKLRDDRADVIVPALLIYLNVMKWTCTETIYVPQIGLADGLIHSLYEELKISGIAE